MAAWRYDPYLWVHLAGLATVPLWLDLGLLGLAVGNPTFPALELAVIIAIGVLPVLAMQLVRPFCIYSVPGLALRPTAMGDERRRLLTQFRGWRVRLGALLVPLPLVWVLLKLYPLAFLARDLTPFDGGGRWGGVAIAAFAFLMANLFLQVPVAVLQVLATSTRRLSALPPYPVAAVATDFTLVGWPVGHILPDIAAAPAPAHPRSPSADHPDLIPSQMEAGADSPPLGNAENDLPGAAVDRGVPPLEHEESSSLLPPASEVDPDHGSPDHPSTGTVSQLAIQPPQAADKDVQVEDQPLNHDPENSHPETLHPETLHPEIDPAAVAEAEPVEVSAVSVNSYINVG
ncbi:MAG TPA: low-complexity tail membrane protein [Nodosilinea sp.]|nr:low-complexity tail membrane protein [Nodosilinea sp.]